MENLITEKQKKEYINSISWYGKTCEQSSEMWNEEWGKMRWKLPMERLLNRGWAIQYMFCVHQVENRDEYTDTIYRTNINIVNIRMTVSCLFSNGTKLTF